MADEIKGPGKGHRKPLTPISAEEAAKAEKAKITAKGIAEEKGAISRKEKGETSKAIDAAGKKHLPKPDKEISTEEAVKLFKHTAKTLKNGVLLNGEQLKALQQMTEKGGFIDQVTPEQIEYYNEQLAGKSPEEISEFIYDAFNEYIQDDGSNFTPEFLQMASGDMPEMAIGGIGGAGGNKPPKSAHDFFSLMLLIMEISTTQKDMLAQLARDSQALVQFNLTEKASALEKKGQIILKVGLISGGISALGAVTSGFIAAAGRDALSMAVGKFVEGGTKALDALGRYGETGQDVQMTKIEKEKEKNNFNKEEAMNYRRSQGEMAQSLLDAAKQLVSEIETTKKAAGRNLLI